MPRKSAKYFFVYYFNNLLELCSDSEYAGKERDIEGMCEEYRSWGKGELKGYANERIWGIITATYFKYWDYYHYDSIQLEKEWWKNYNKNKT